MAGPIISKVFKAEIFLLRLMQRDKVTLLGTSSHINGTDYTVETEAAAAITFHKNDFMHISAMKNFSSIILYDLRLSHSHRTTDGRAEGRTRGEAAAALKSVYTILREYYAPPRRGLLQEVRRRARAAAHASVSHLGLQILTPFWDIT